MPDPMASMPIGHNATIPNGSDFSQQSQLAILDIFFPGFSGVTNVVQRYLGINLNIYIPLLLLAGVLTYAWSYATTYLWDQVTKYFMSVVNIPADDEIYDILMAWVSGQYFAQNSRSFIVNTTLNSRDRFFWRWDCDDDEDEEVDDKAKKDSLAYTPSYGSHYFFYRGYPLKFSRSVIQDPKPMYGVAPEDISLSCFGRDPWILKELLLEARRKFSEKDKLKTLIYRGTRQASSGEPRWQRCLARERRPFSTVILNEKVKKDLIDDVTDYLSPSTRRWYSNRGIPYRRGYLLYGPPGTGKSSLSLALAGFFRMRIYIVSLSSVTASEETLSALFGELPRRCVVLLEDIDTAGLTHTREDQQPQQTRSEPKPSTPAVPPSPDSAEKSESGRLSLSGLLNVLDGVASQEGRILIMTTNHLEKLDKALIRPGRVDMIVNFGLADKDMVASIFRALFSYLEGDDEPDPVEQLELEPEARQAYTDEKAKKRATEDARVEGLAQEFAAMIPAHEFSPAELQGYLMRYKRRPEAAVANVVVFIETTRRDRKEKELKEAEEKRKAEEDKKAAEAKGGKGGKETKEAEKDKNDVKDVKGVKDVKDVKDGDSKATCDCHRSQEQSPTSTDKKPTAISTSADATVVIEPPTLQTLEEKTKEEPGHLRHDSGYATPIGTGGDV